MNPRLRLTLVLVALAAGLANVASSLLLRNESDPSLGYLLIRNVGVSWSFVAAGLVAWSGRPQNRTGALMVAVGLAWSLHGLALVHTPIAFVLWFALATLPDAILGHLIAVFPEGYATTRLQRVFIVANYATTVPLALVQLLFVTPQQLGCVDCPNDLLRAGNRDRYGDTVLAVSDLSVVFLVALLLAILIIRWHRATAPRRRSLAPVFGVGIALLVVYAVQQALVLVLGLHPASNLPGFDLAILVLLVLWPVAFLAGLARGRLDRSAVGDLAIRLGDTLSPSRLERALADALHDPTLRLAYWSSERQLYVDPAGRQIQLPPDGGSRTATVLRNDREPVAALLHDNATLDQDPQLVRAVGATVRMSIENERLHAQLRAQLEEVRASRARIVEFGDAERRRVERNLHDGAQQRLVNLALALGLARSLVDTASPAELGAALDEAAVELRQALAELRQLARGIHPVILGEAGLAPALTSLAERSPIPVSILAVPPARPPQKVEETAYYVASEALANAAKHAHATAVTVSARRVDGRLIVDVADDGVGGADPDGSGLRGLADRVAALDGEFQLQSRPGSGTRIVARLPCES